ncbi:F0F1 ATP synthase subunit B [Sphingomonas donggukensis]|uniref:ATP synthase subunit b n=1 Tax=Sphingomonas donggukensis TaxID=2949093 RepID=A0ABY4TUC0_9SPHN|nr:F0F1 ATP synthase subunit B [Sphingomonas donggukensis]URW76005.1 F0F1 ATP synthase subunit B [Sphingomonas donggukensis]
MANVTAGSVEVAQNLSNADHAQGLPDTGGKAVTTEHAEVGTEHHADPAFLGLDATVWVSLAMLAFLAILIVKKVPAVIAAGLDKQIAAIRQRLEEAKQLRTEAEALRDEYARKLGDIENQTRAIVEHAEDEAKAMIAKAETDAADLVTRRARMAEDKIAAAERTAIADVRAKAADAATRAAGTLIAAKHGAEADQSLVDKTIAGLGRLN